MMSTGNPAGIVSPWNSRSATREATLVLRRRLVAQHLLDGGAGERRVGLELGQLVGVLGEGHHRVADQLGDRLGAGRGEEEDEARHLRVGEALDRAVLALDLGLRRGG